MLVIHGKKVIKKPVGWAVDFCPVCRLPTVMRVRSLETAHHVYWITVSASKPVSLERCCEDCGVYSVVPRDRYPMLAPEPLELESLLEMTNPDLLASLESVLDTEERLSGLPRGSESRMKFMAGTMLAVRGWARDRARHGASAKLTGLLAGVFILDSAILAGFARSGYWIIWPAAGLVFVLLPVLLYRSLTSMKRAVGKEMIPMLAHAFAGIDPDEAEIREVYRRRLGRQFRNTVKINPRKLREAVVQAQSC